ncbi:MAG: 50S ribosomal protein L21 [Bacteroidota bacterium]
MSAIVNIAGKQINVKISDTVCVPKLHEKVGGLVSFNQVLLLKADEKCLVGTPFVTGAQVLGKVLAHGKEDKIIVYKKKRRKGYEKKNGHRQQYTKIAIEKIINNSSNGS